jgi:DNA polymerase III delta subunit
MSADAPVVAYYWGDDGWMIDRAVVALARAIERDSGAAPDRWRINGRDTTSEAIGERVTTAPMFGGGTLAIVADAGPLVRTRADVEALNLVIATVAPGNALVFLEVATWDPKKRPAWAVNLAAAVVKAGGTEKPFRAPESGNQLAAWIQGRASELDLRIDAPAAQELAKRVGGFETDTDIDRTRMGALAVGELEKLALYRLDGQVSVDDVRDLVPEVIPDSTWAFLDAIADRRTQVAGPLLDRILEASAEQLLIVQLHRRLRELLIAADHQRSGGPPSELVKLLAIHPYRVEKAAQAARRWKVEELEAALDGLLELDAMTKRVTDAGGSDRQRRMAWVTWVAERVAGAGGGDARGAARAGSRRTR